MLLVYLLMVVNFQSWLDPLIILMALPGALCGILWMLFVTGTTINVPSLMGAIMCIGVATANSHPADHLRQRSAASWVKTRTTPLGRPGSRGCGR